MAVRLKAESDVDSADRVRKDIYSLGAKIDVNVKSVFTSRKLPQTLRVKQSSTLNALYTNFNVICAIKLCRVHFQTLTSTHKWTMLFSQPLETQHGNNRTKTDHFFKVLRKCDNKFDYLLYEMLYIKDITCKPTSFVPNCLRDTFGHFFLCSLLYFLPWELYT